MVARLFSAQKVARSSRVPVESFCHFFFPWALLHLGVLLSLLPLPLSLLCVWLFQFDYFVDICLCGLPSSSSIFELSHTTLLPPLSVCNANNCQLLDVNLAIVQAGKSTVIYLANRKRQVGSGRSLAVDPLIVC